MVTMIVCDPTDKTFTLIMAGGAYSLKIGNRGELLAAANIVGMAEADPAVRAQIDAIGGPRAYDDLTRRISA